MGAEAAYLTSSVLLQSWGFPARQVWLPRSPSLGTVCFPPPCVVACTAPRPDCCCGWVHHPLRALSRCFMLDSGLPAVYTKSALPSSLSFSPCWCYPAWRRCTSLMVYPLLPCARVRYTFTPFASVHLVDMVQVAVCPSESCPLVVRVLWFLVAPVLLPPCLWHPTLTDSPCWAGYLSWLRVPS